MSGQNADEKPIAFSEPEKPILDSISGINFRISDEHLGEGSPKQKFRANMDAIHMLKKLETEERNATWQEQEILSKYVGWGGIPEAFDEKRAQWANEYQELKETLTEEEYIAARASTLNAHFTSPAIIREFMRRWNGWAFKEEIFWNRQWELETFWNAANDSAG